MAITRKDLKAGVAYRVSNAGYNNSGKLVYLVYDDESSSPKFNQNKDAGRFELTSEYINLSDLKMENFLKVGDLIESNVSVPGRLLTRAVVIAVNSSFVITTTFKFVDDLPTGLEKGIPHQVVTNSVERTGHLLESGSWRIITEEEQTAPEVTELTLEQIADKFGLDTENIRIKE